jgi:hypothetical protein
MSITRSTCCSPSTSSNSPLGFLPPISFCFSAGSSVSTTRLDLPEPDDAGHAGEDAQREVHRQVAQVVSARPAQAQGAVAALAPVARDLDALAPRQVGAGDALGVADDVLGAARGNDAAAALAGLGAHVDDPVGGAHGVLVVLDDQHAVAQIAQLQQRAHQAGVVPLVQADAGLVQDVQHAHQAGPDLGGQTDALGLAARQRGRRAIQRQVVQTDVHQERQPLADLAQDALGHQAGRGG